MLSPVLSASLPKRDGALCRLRDLVRDDLARVDQKITTLVESHIALIPELSLHTLLSGGKRLRPILTLASARLCGYSGDAHIALATSVECIHTATLLHDDVVDKSSLRRGKSTANIIWGNKESILVGDFLLGRAFYLMAEACSLEVYRILSKAAMVISEGEVMQLDIEGRLDITQNTYLEVIAAKTAELFAAACEISGIVADQEPSISSALRTYGYQLGIAFQIVDDALDYVATHEAFGKEVGDDFRDAKITLPVLLAYEGADDVQKVFWNRTLSMRDQQEGDIATALQYIKYHRAVEKCMKIADGHLQLAKESLSIFKDTPEKQALLDLLVFVKEREY